MANVREFFYSNRLLQWLPVAGSNRDAPRARPAAALTAVWVAVATVVAVATPTSFDGGRFFVDLVPAWPAYALLVAAIPALVPTLVARLGDRIVGEVDAPEVSRASAVILFGAVVVSPASSPHWWVAEASPLPHALGDGGQELRRAVPRLLGPARNVVEALFQECEALGEHVL